ncbi:MAG: ATPase [Alphaproteobacteria bacterium]|nr:ATPase [Alphaproteobacteria bacterium]
MKRVYKAVAVAEGENGFAVHLDGRTVRSPARRDLILPNRALAEAVAAEWDAQAESIDPRTMPFMSLVATAADRVEIQRDHVIETIAGYAGSDMLCYRAEEPADLVRRQNAIWDPLLDWTADALGARLRVTTGIMPVRQDEAALNAIQGVVAGYEPLAMTALHEITSIAGSVVIGLAVTEGHIDADAGVVAAQLDETFQIEQNGEEEEAVERLANLRADLLAAAEFLRLSRAWN